MTLAASGLPSVAFRASRPPDVQLNLRTDVAWFAGRTRRGPVAEAVRVEGYRQYLSVFGGLTADDHTPRALQGYFDNGGEVAWVWRLGGDAAQPAHGQAAFVVWELPNEPVAAALGLDAVRYRVSASSPGGWGNRLQVRIVLRRRPDGSAVADVFVEAADESAERLLGLPCAALVAEVARRSTYLRLEPIGPRPVSGAAGAGPLTMRFSFALRDGTEPTVDLTTYERAVDAAADSDEPALAAFPDLPRDLGNDVLRRRVFARAAGAFSQTLDRLVVVDLPENVELATAAEGWFSSFGDASALARAAVAYHPWLRINDPLGSIAAPQRTVPPSGHVLGVISRLDRERGAAATPANASVEGAVDVSRRISDEELAGLHTLGVNALLCQPGRGLVIWGGRMLGAQPGASASFVAHRRLIHRLIRAIRQTARPLVFDVNGPKLWFALARSATTVLLEAYRARTLQGARPEEGFRVRCDAELNPPEVVERGQVICEISLAPAVPMEFITVRVALSADGQLEVMEP